MRKVVVFGEDQSNTVGVIQSLADGGFVIDALLFGDITDIVKSSKFVSHIISAHDEEACVSLLINNPNKNKTAIPIIPCCDSVALALDKHKNSLVEKGYLCGGTYKSQDFSSFFSKDLQVKMAEESGLYVPFSTIISDETDLFRNKLFPCLIKPLVSCLGSKSHIHICRDQKELVALYNSIGSQNKMILQQYINRDYEISILGCGLKNGACIIPAVEDKLSLYPKYVGLECLANVHSLNDKEIINGITHLIQKIGYVGLFSVEMMHCKDDNRFYFTEINLRNDGAQSFIYKYGVNLPLIHVHDLLELPLPKVEKLHPGFYIWDMHHLKSLLAGDISIVQWFHEHKKSQGLLMYDKRDKKPFIKQYIYFIRKKIQRKKVRKY